MYMYTYYDARISMEATNSIDIQLYTRFTGKVKKNGELHVAT